MTVIWNGELCYAVKMTVDFTLDDGVQVMTGTAGEYVVTTKQGQIIATEEEINAEQEKFNNEYTYQLQDFQLESTEEDVDYIQSFYAKRD